MATDLTKMPLEILVDLINMTDGCSLSLSDISFGPVSVLRNSSRDTQVTVTATPNSAYTGYRDVTYNRIQMSTIPGMRSTIFDLSSAFSMADLIPTINTMYKLNLQPEDYFDDVLPNVNDPNAVLPITFTLRAKPASYIYQGSLELTARSAKELLSQEIVSDTLTGFIFLQPNPPLQPI